MTLDEFLTDDDKRFKDEINKAKQDSGLPDFIFQSYRIIGPLEKILIYNRIKVMSEVEFRKIDRLKQDIKSSNGTKIHWEGFQTVVDICRQFIFNSELNR